MGKILKYKDLTPEDHRILKAMFDGLSMCHVVEKEEYPYEETLYEKIQREQQPPNNGVNQDAKEPRENLA